IWRVFTGRGGIGPGGFSFDQQSGRCYRHCGGCARPRRAAFWPAPKAALRSSAPRGDARFLLVTAVHYRDGPTRAVPSGKKQAVTNRDKKDSTRGRMADTGEPFNVARRKTEAAIGFFDDLPAPEPAPLRRHHPWQPPEAELPGTVPIDTVLLGRTDQVVVAL